MQTSLEVLERIQTRMRCDASLDSTEREGRALESTQNARQHNATAGGSHSFLHV